MVKLRLQGEVHIETVRDGRVIETRIIRNTITENLKRRLRHWLMHDINKTTVLSAVTHIGVGCGTSLVAVPDQLVKELDREAIDPRRQDAYNRAQLCAQFTSDNANGAWTEMGLFDADILSDIESCDNTTDWSSDNSLTLDSTERMYGSTALKSVGSGTNSFVNSAMGLQIDAQEDFFQKTMLQAWYFIDDVTKLTTDPLIKFGNDSSNYWSFYYPRNMLTTNDWTLLQVRLCDCLKTGSPDLDATMNYFTLSASKSGSVTERLDKVRYFTRPAGYLDPVTGGYGNLLAYISINPPAIKNFGEVKNVYWYITVQQAEE